jgi:hypothetical protein
MKDEQEKPMKQTDLPSQPESLPGHLLRRRLLGIILILGGLGWFLFELVSRGTIAGINLNLASASIAESISAQRFAVSRVEVTGINDQVILSGTTGEEVILSGERHGFGWATQAAAAAATQVTIEVEQRGDTLYVHVRHQPQIMWHFGRDPYARLELALPPDVTFNVGLVSGDVMLRQVVSNGDITTISGDVVASDTNGQLTIETTSGDIEVRNHDGSLRVVTVSGDLEAVGQFTDVRVETTEGDVALRGKYSTARIITISGDVTIEAEGANQISVETTSGNIRFTGQLASEQQEMVTISGDVELTLSKPLDARINITTVSGRISLPVQFADQQASARSLTATFGQGQTMLKVETTSGDISLRLREE